MLGPSRILVSWRRLGPVEVSSSLKNPQLVGSRMKSHEVIQKSLRVIVIQFYTIFLDDFFGNESFDPYQVYTTKIYIPLRTFFMQTTKQSCFIPASFGPRHVMAMDATIVMSCCQTLKTWDMFLFVSSSMKLWVLVPAFVLIFGGKVDGQVIHQLKKHGFQVEVLPLRLGDGPFSSHRQHRVACAALRSKCREVCVKTQWDHWRFSVGKATLRWYIAREKDRAMEGDGCVYWLGPVMVISFVFNFLPEIWGRWTHFDEHSLQMGWFNQPAKEAKDECDSLLMSIHDDSLTHDPLLVIHLPK